MEDSLRFFVSYLLKSIDLSIINPKTSKPEKMYFLILGKISYTTPHLTNILSVYAQVQDRDRTRHTPKGFSKMTGVETTGNESDGGS